MEIMNKIRALTAYRRTAAAGGLNMIARDIKQPRMSITNKGIRSLIMHRQNLDLKYAYHIHEGFIAVGPKEETLLSIISKAVDRPIEIAELSWNIISGSLRFDPIIKANRIRVNFDVMSDKHSPLESRTVFNEFFKVLKSDESGFRIVPQDGEKYLCSGRSSYSIMIEDMWSSK